MGNPILSKALLRVNDAKDEADDIAEQNLQIMGQIATMSKQLDPEFKALEKQWDEKEHDVFHA